MANQTKRRPVGYSDAELKAYDGLSKTELFEVLGKVMRSGYTAPTPLDLAKEIKRINHEINPPSESGSAGTSGGVGRILSAAQYLALTAVSAHAGGMPAALYDKAVSKEHREAFQSRGLVEIGDGGAAKVTTAGNAVLDAYEAKKRESSGQTGGGTPLAPSGVQGIVGGTATAQGSGATGTGAGQPPQPSQPVAGSVQPPPVQQATVENSGDQPAPSPAASTSGVGDFGS